MTDLGFKLKRLREGKRLTIADLSTHARVAESTISDIETGVSPQPRRLTLEKLVKVLGVSVADLYSKESQCKPLTQSPKDAHLLGDIAQEWDWICKQQNADVREKLLDGFQQCLKIVFPREWPNLLIQLKARSQKKAAA